MAGIVVTPTGIYHTLLTPVVAVLTVATLLELVLLRTFTRSAIHIPDVEALQAPYFALADAGRFAYFAAVTSLVCVLLLVVAASFSRSSARSWAAALGGGLFVVAASMERLDILPLALGVALMGAAVVMAAAAALRTPRMGLFVAPMAGAFVLATLAAIDNAAGSGGLSALHGAREIPVVAAGLLAPAALGVRLTGRRLMVAILAAALVFAVFAANPSTSRILLLWNAGLSGVLPGAVYALAAGAAAGTLAGLAGRRQWIAVAALVLVAASGVTVENTYQTGLLVCGLLLLAWVDATVSNEFGIVRSQRSAHLAEDASG